MDRLRDNARWLKVAIMAKGSWKVWALLFLISLVIFAGMSKRVIFHDSSQYISSAKEFAGISNAKVHNGHTFVYPFFLAQFLRFAPSALTFKIVNLMWLFLLGLLVYGYTRNEKSLLIWIFSPIVWIMSIWTSSLVVAGFFLTLAYVCVKKWEKSKKLSYYAISALSIGMACSFWSPAVAISSVFLLIFFYDKSFKQMFWYLILIIPTFSINLLIDYIYFGSPFYTLSYFTLGTFFIIRGMSAANSPAFDYKWLMFFVVISPLLFMLYKAKFSKYPKEYLWCLFMFILASIYGTIKYAVVPAGVLVIMLGDVFKKRDVLIHASLSLIIIIYTVSAYGYFDPFNKDVLLEKDLKKIYSDYGFDTVIAANEVAGTIAPADVLNSVYWAEKPFIIWGSDYVLYKLNKTEYSEYNFYIKPKIKMVREISATFKNSVKFDQDFNGKPMLVPKDEPSPEGFKKDKCYEILCVYLPLTG